MTIKLHCDDESGRTLKINIAPCLCRPYTQASEIGWGGVPWGRYVGGRSCAPNMFNHNRRSNFLRAASPQPGKNTSPARGPGDAHSTLEIFFFALQIFFPRILRFPPTRPVPAAVTDVSRVCWCKSDAGEPQKSAWVCFALVCGAFFALAARGSHWIERQEEVKCNKCPEFFPSAVIEKVQCATALFCQPPATMHLQTRQFSAGRSKSMKAPTSLRFLLWAWCKY